MKTTTVLSKCATVVLLILLVFIGGWTTPPGAAAQANMSQVAVADLQFQPPSQGISLTFMENIGQFDASVRFQASNGNTTLFLTDDALWVSLTDLPPQADPVSEAKAPAAVAGADESGRRVDLKLSFSGANHHPRLEPFEEQGVKVSFLTGADPSQWRADVPAWAGVRYVNLYPGIDLEITGQNGQLTPRLVVREPASLPKVSLRVEGADALAVQDNHLRLTTPLGDFALPLLTVAGADPKVEPAISMADDIPQVSAPFASTSLLAPGVTSTGTPDLRYSTYLGGSGTDQASSIALDSEGNVYIIGRTYSTDLPTTPGAYDISQNGAYDVFVTKLGPDGGTLLYSTYLGGSSEDIGTGIAVDSAGNAYITGHTYSTDFPTTPGASDTTLSGQRDAFVAKLNESGNGLVYSTYLGGDSWDYGKCIAIDDSGSAYVGGFTHGSFPVTAGAAQTVFGGMGDGFVTKFSPDGGTVLYSTYIGGYSWEAIPGIAVDHAGHAYLATGTPSDDFPTTPGAYDRVCENCSTNYSGDAAAVKLSADGSQFVYSTLVGGTKAPSEEGFLDVAVDSAGNAYFVGLSNETNFPTTPNALQRSLGGGEDVVVVKLNADGSDLLYSTYLGGSGIDRGYGITIDENGNAYVTGRTTSTNLPTVNPLQAVNAGGYDAFLAVVNADASALLYSSYLGGSGDENRESNGDGYADIALDPTRRTVHLTGYTASTDFPTTANAYDRSFNGGASDAFVTGLSVTTDTDTFTRITSGDIVNEGGRSTGACWGDYDNDGYFDLFVANWAGENNFLYHNSGDGTFEKITSGSVVNDGGSSRSCTWGDYDNDGFADLAVSDDGGGIFLYHNEDGASFTRVLDTPIAQDYGNCYGISWADYDNDGWLDLFVARHTNDSNLLYHNKGNGVFEKITDGAIVNDGGYSVPVSWGDYDADGCVDLFVGNVNDQSSFLYHNNCNGSFDRITHGPIAADVGFSTTSNWVDYDNDGDLDLFVGNWYKDNFLYRNDGGGTFTKLTTGVIVTDGNIHDSSWADYDNDGDMDLVGGTPEGLRRFYQNNGDGAFTRITTGTIVEDNHTSGPNWADYDNDGDLDLFVAVNDPPYTNLLYRNDGVGNHWLHLKLIGAGPKQAKTATVSNKSAIGTRVTVAATINGRAVQQMQEVSGQTGVFSQNSPNVEFGLGDATVINAITVKWPSGAVQVLTNMAVDQLLTIREPRCPLKVHYLPLVAKSAQAEWLVTPGVALRVPRFWHTATRLTDGRILLVGGSWATDDYLSDVDIFDPVTGQTSRAAPLHTPRHFHTATLLFDGRVLVIGGGTIGSVSAYDAEVYDPVADTWTVVSPQRLHGDLLTATLMKDGRVLVVGGLGAGEHVDIFDPTTNTWGEAQPLPPQVLYHTAQLLEDGRVLVAGGVGVNNAPPAGGDAQLYDPRTDTWTATGPMMTPRRILGESVRLSDGRVLVVGGALAGDSVPPILASAEIFDPASNTWTAAASLAQARFHYELVLLPSGQVLAIGGARVWDSFWTGNSFVREIELYDPATNRWRIVGELPVARAGSAAALLPDGRVWLTGGRNDTTYFSDSWLIGQPQSAEGSLYFVRGDVLYRMNTDGSDLRTVAHGLQGNEALVVDPIHRKIYAGRWEQPAQIQVFDMSAGELKAFSDGPGWGGQGMVLDPADLNLYRGLYYSGVYVMNLNSAGNWTQLVNSASLDPMYGQRGQLQVDPVNHYIYFRSSHNSCQSCRYIWRVNYDGSALTRIIPANGGDALALDLTERKLYFTDLPGDYTIKRANLDGSAVETLLTIPGAYHFSSIALDANSRKMYLSLWNKDSEPQIFKRAIARMNMDGSGFDILHTIAGNTGEEVVGEMALYLPTSPAPEPPLLARYDFEGDFLASGTVLDRSGNGHDTQVTGAVASTPGISGGQGIAFDGNGYLQAASNPAAGKTNVTFSLWFKTIDPTQNYKLASGAWWNWGPGSGWIMATHGPEFWSDDTQGLFLPGQPNNENHFTAGEWIHEVVTYDGSRIKEYTNGQLINDWPTTGAAIGQGTPMVVGAWPPFTAYNFRGSMDEFAIYGRSLTQQEVQALYAHGR